MRSILGHQALRSLYTFLQAAIVAAFIGVALYSLMAMQAGTAVTQTNTSDKSSCVQKLWLVLPFAFITGGLMSIDSFASTAVLLL
mmetsp:Transcript_75162/g.141770  ORF Transcript_75162/g.141770 Transcript_75162/m.141770 type:complete len:85 (-) Transcript_75162:92-346(-)